MRDRIEFHVAGRGHFLTVSSSHAPDRDDLVNIYKVTYRVVGRTYTIDYAEDARMTEVACIINLEPHVQ